VCGLGGGGGGQRKEIGQSIFLQSDRISLVSNQLYIAAVARSLKSKSISPVQLSQNNTIFLVLQACCTKMKR